MHAFTCSFFIIHSNTRWTDSRRVLLNNDRLQFGTTASTFTVLNTTDTSGRPTESTIVSREISTVNVTYPSFQTQLSYTLVTANSPDCLNTGTFMAPPPQLQYQTNSMLWMNIQTPGNLISLRSPAYTIHYCT